MCVRVCASVYVLCSFLKYLFNEQIQLNVCCLFLCASCTRIEQFSANVNSRYMLLPVSLSVVCNTRALRPNQCCYDHRTFTATAVVGYHQANTATAVSSSVLGVFLSAVSLKLPLNILQSSMQP